MIGVVMQEMKLPTNAMRTANRKPLPGLSQWTWRLPPARWQPNRVGIGVMVVVVLLCLAAPLAATHDPAAVDLRTGLQPPSAAHWLGSDQLGRDVWSRVVWAGQASLLVTGIVLVLSLLLGLGVGLVSGYGGGWIDHIDRTAGAERAAVACHGAGTIRILSSVGRAGAAVSSVGLSVCLSAVFRL